MDKSAAQARIEKLAEAEGFPLVRFAPAAPLIEARHAALERHRQGDLAEMAWMTEEWLVRATDPGRFLVDAKTVVVLGLGYRPGKPAAAGRGSVAAYAQGRDYHRVFETKLRRMARAIREELGASARPTVDYGPLLERPLAAIAGMGWQGKSTMLLAPGFGPWVMLGAIATDLDLATSAPLKKSCGSCTRCVVACPTGALGEDGGVLDSRLCISYHTIENRGPIPRELRAKFGSWVFGCDDCLDSCPVGRAMTGGRAALELAPLEDEVGGLDLAEILSLSDESFALRFRGRAIMRTKRDGLVRNACVALGNVGGATDVAPVVGALSDASALVRGHAAWGLGALSLRLGGGWPAEAAGRMGEALAGEGDPWVREELEAAMTVVTSGRAPA